MTLADLYATSWLPLAALVAGIVVGVLLTHLLHPCARRARRLDQELEGTRSELSQYREEVGQHFHKTSELFHDMTVRYRAIYDHLAAGAESLCTGQQGRPQLDFPEARYLPGEAPAREEEAAEAPTGADSPAPADDQVAGDSAVALEADGAAVPPAVDTGEGGTDERPVPGTEPVSNTESEPGAVTPPGRSP